MRSHNFSGLSLLPLPLPAPGFSSFIGSWLFREDGVCFLVDPGPSASIPALCRELGRLGVTRLSFILLTHIHLDHAGGTGDLLREFGKCPVVCHASAMAHLAEPSRLWEGSIKNLGDLARSYGAPRPVEKESLLDAAGFSEAGVRPIITPGHAQHHVSYLFRDILFAGETGGVYADLGNGRFYLRPATPPRFFWETSLDSLELLMGTPHKLYCYGHFGATQNSKALMAAHQDQLFLWRDETAAIMKIVPEKEQIEACLARLLARDEFLAGFNEFAPEDQGRERYFLTNSIRGFLGYLRS